MKLKLVLGLFSVASVLLCGWILFPGLTQHPPTISKYESPANRALSRHVAEILLDADTSARTGDYAAAEADFNQVLTLKPKMAGTHLWLAELHEKEGHTKDVLSNYRMGLQLPNATMSYPSLMIHYGELCLAAGDIPEARLAFANAVNSSAGFYGAALKPALEDTTKTSTLHGIAFASMATSGGFLDERLVRMRQAYALAPESPYVCYAYGDLLQRLMQYADARHYFDLAIRLTPSEQRDTVIATINRLGSMKPFSDITTINPDGHETHRLVSRQLENMPLILPPHGSVSRFFQPEIQSSPIARIY